MITGTYIALVKIAFHRRWRYVIWLLALLQRTRACYENGRQMALTPLRIVILLLCTLVLSIAGVVLLAMGTHGSQALTWLGGFLLLPNVILMQLGVPVKVPLLNSVNVLSILLFVILQTGYYYVLFWLVNSVIRRRRKVPV
jgi:hypothetical protein